MVFYFLSELLMNSLISSACQKPYRINKSFPVMYFKMQMRPGTLSRTSNMSDDRICIYLFPFFDKVGLIMGIFTDKAIPVVNDNKIAIACLFPTKDHLSIFNRMNLGSDRC